ncbi:MAG: phosphatase PAP2 family protein [Candidatus Dojkabacteria bacterium]
MTNSITTFFKNKYRAIFLILFAFLLLYINFYIYGLGFNAIAVFLIILAIVLRKEKEFIKDWSIPIFLLYLYEFLRGKAYVISELLNRPFLNGTLIGWENKLFCINGELPTVYLQSRLSNVASGIFTPNWYDYILFIAYASFFGFWLIIGLWIWNKRKEIFNRYIYGLVGLSMVSIVIFIMYPSAPPWYASEVGLLPPLDRLMLVYDFFSAKYMSLVGSYGYNDFAAFPSLHAGWSFYASIFAIGVFGKKALPLLIVPLLIVFATWYGAEHYVIDSLFGFFLAGVTYLLVNRGFRVKK